MKWLKQSTASTVVLGPFVDATDAVTAETSLTISQADIRLSKNGGTFAQTNNNAGATHMENGFYSVPLDTTDTNTLGRLRVAVSESGALPVWEDFMVLPANVFDSLVAGSDNLQVDVTQVGGSTQDIATATALATVDSNVDAILVDTGTTLPGTLATLATSSALATVDSNVDSILEDTGTTLPATLSTIAGYIDTEVAAILEDTGTTLPGLLSTIDTVVDAIKAVTDNLPDSGALSSLSTFDSSTDTVILAAQTHTGATIPNVTTTGSVTAPVDLATGSVDAAAVADDAVDAFWDEAVEGTITGRQVMRALLAAMAGVLSGAATTEVTISTPDGNTTRITAQVDADGNRSAVTLSLT